MKQVSGRDLARILQQRGWLLARIQGSHHIFTMSGRRERIVVPIHWNRPLKTGLLRSLMKIADLREEDFKDAGSALAILSNRGAEWAYVSFI